MAVSTVIAGNPSAHRAAQVPTNAYQGALALDWANGQSLTLGGSSVSSTVFDATADRIVFCSVGGTSTGVGGAYITVGSAAAIATSGAGSLYLPQQEGLIAIYVPLNNIIAALQGAAAGTLQAIPALKASAP